VNQVNLVSSFLVQHFGFLTVTPVSTKTYASVRLCGAEVCMLLRALP